MDLSQSINQSLLFVQESIEEQDEKAHRAVTTARIVFYSVSDINGDFSRKSQIFPTPYVYHPR